MLAALVVLSGCTDDAGDAGTAAPGAPVDATATDASSGEVVLVLPPADALAPPAREDLRALVERAVVERGGDAAGWALLEPATGASLADTIEIAVRRTGGDGTVCMVGTRGRVGLGPALARYPAARGCVVPGPAPTGVPDGRVAVGDADLTLLGRELGLAARAAAGEGAVLLLDGGDALLDVRWRRGVEEGVLGAAGATGPTLGIVATAAQALALLDEQAALLAEGVVPGGPAASVPGEDGAGLPEARDGLPLGDVLPSARSLLPVTVVVLDAGVESPALATALAERGVRVVAPTVLLDAGLVAREDVVLHWSVRWDAVLLAALDGGGTVTPSSDDPFVLVAGPAATRP